YITKGRTGSAAYVWVNKKNPLGAAGFIGPGVAKPGISFELATETSNAKKIAVSDKVATELLQDIPGMASYIQQELAYQLKAKMNTTLMTGASSSTVPAGIQTLSTTFTLTTIATANPGNWDAIVALVAQLRSGNLMGPVTVFMNPVDYANMKLHKAASQGQLFIPSESGATIVEDNNIAVGYIQAAILPYYRILIYQDFTVAFGWENDDFTKNLVTTIAEMRVHQMFSENYTGAFIYDTLANIKTAITAV
ncbi:major_cap_HK97, phage major capsid protein, HK97 family, partial [uncultured Caudovirales phage]